MATFLIIDGVPVEVPHETVATSDAAVQAFADAQARPARATPAAPTATPDRSRTRSTPPITPADPDRAQTGEE